MKVGILTFHEIYNPGAYLQAMGTFSLLKSMGHEAVIIDYNPPAHRYSLGKMLSRPKMWLMPRLVLEVVGRNRAFAKAQNHFERTRRLNTHADLEQERFDAVVIGADIVWDYLTPNLGNDAVYFGAHLNAPRKISFAASCGRIPVDNAPPSYVVKGLADLSAISVRDANTQEMVKRYSGRDSVVICDPAFHLDIKPHTVLPKTQAPYLLVYVMPPFASDEFIEQVKVYAQENGLKTIAVCYRQKWTDENRICIGPQEWLGYIQNAAAVATNTFHGTIFSIKAGVPFVAELNDAIRLKMIAMIERLEIGDRFFSSEQSVRQILDTAWSVDKVHRQIEEWRAEAVDFLKTALAETER